MLPVVLYFENEEWQRSLFMFYTNAFLRSFGAQITYHGEKPKLDKPHIFVANHTSLIDYIVLSANGFPHAVIAQSHGGVLGFFLKSVLALNGSLIFDRAAKNDRHYVPLQMKQHTRDVRRSPLLIFPEGTCVNNEYTVLFHKGAFELDAAVCPVAIKYNKKWADAYWFRTSQTFVTHLLFLMTRWALVADVWYMAPETRGVGESTVEFANRTKALISKQAKLKNLSWDGYFKHMGPPKDKQDRLKENPQSRYGAILLHRLRQPDGPTTDRLGRMRRANTIAMGEVPALRKVNVVPDWLLHGAETTQKGNEMLVALEDNNRRTDMIQAIESRKSDVVQVWRQYTKMRSATETRARIEYSSWRVWFKQRIEREAKRREQEILDQQSQMSPSSDAGWLDYFSEAATTATVVLRRNLSSRSMTNLSSLMTMTSTTAPAPTSNGHHSRTLSSSSGGAKPRKLIINSDDENDDDEGYVDFGRGKRLDPSKRPCLEGEPPVGVSKTNGHIRAEPWNDKPPIIAAN
ncbi:hypothetical protein SmJEL517_g02086 [Synchytrium microbalum]|uniref:Phospholipid/glycerol acyltransferase domain-containing protein n=1 Tax=Synchytrium microbalum TaxID=1806994 RepID=A0A507C8U0_9FUNG|nr:uncharacterized protein SmJEL517_g02086 [Synchytrium microbalum]TPX35569.1 hypothetical protein SmJEL517_g02086 [Synchytrium microbalum]